MKVEIDLKKWLRGEGGGNSCLYRGRDRKMCCLGFLGMACGVWKGAMLNVRAPLGLTENNRKLFPRELNEKAIAAINDCKEVDDDIRMAWIEEAFLHLRAPDGTPCEVVWVGKNDSLGE